MQLVVDGEPGQLVCVAAYEIPASVALPATVRIPLPAGARVTWAGETLATGAGAGDVQRKFQVIGGAGGRYVEFTAQKSRKGQVESVAAPLTRSGATVTGSVKWVQSAPAASETFSVRFPPSAADAKTQPAAIGGPQRNAVGETLYPLPQVKLKLGETYPVSVSFQIPPALGAAKASSSAQQSGGSSTPLFVLLAALVVAGIALAFALARGRRSPSDE